MHEQIAEIVKRGVGRRLYGKLTVDEQTGEQVDCCAACRDFDFEL